MRPRRNQRLSPAICQECACGRAFARETGLTTKGGIVTADRPDTIVLIHGFWVTPRSWEHWIDHYERKGFRVLAPAYPGFEVEVEALNADPTPIEEVTVPAIVEHLASVIRPIDPPPVLIGHSAGGVFVQILLDHG